MEYNKRVGVNIYNARKKIKMSRAALGEKVGLHETTIKKYEDGEIKSLDIEKIKDFASALNTTATELLEWEDDLQQDVDIISIERAKKKMPIDQQDKMMKMLRTVFEEYFE